MPRLLGVDIPNNRPAAVSLTYLYGVGPKTANELCRKAASIRPFALRTSLRKKLRVWPRCSITTTLSKVSSAVKLTKYCPSSRNWLLSRIRHRKGLPVRGQRTKTSVVPAKASKRPSPVRRALRTDKVTLEYRSKTLFTARSLQNCFRSSFVTCV